MYPRQSQLPRGTCGALPVDKDAPALVAAAAGAGDGSAELGAGEAQGVVVEAARLQPDGGDAGGGGLEQYAARDGRRRDDGDRRVSGRGQRCHRRPRGVGLERRRRRRRARRWQRFDLRVAGVDGRDREPVARIPVEYCGRVSEAGGAGGAGCYSCARICWDRWTRRQQRTRPT